MVICPGDWRDLRRCMSNVTVICDHPKNGFPQAINAVFPQAQILDFVGWKDRKLAAAELKNIYHAKTKDEAMQALESFSAGPWGLKYPPMAAIWRRQWQEVIPFFLCLPARSAAHHLHDQCDRKPEHADSQGDQEPGPFPQRRRRENPIRHFIRRSLYGPHVTRS